MNRNEEKRMSDRKEAVRRWTFGFCAMTAAVFLGIVTGILIAPKSGEKLLTDLKKGATKTLNTIEKAVHEKTNDEK